MDSDDLVPTPPPTPIDTSAGAVAPSQKMPQPVTATPATGDDLYKKITQEVYKHNLELSTVNKTLSLLRKLYQISLLQLEPATLANKVSEAIQQDLNLEIAGILVMNKETDTLQPLHFSKSDRLVKALDDADLHFKDLPILQASKKPFFQNILTYHTSAMTQLFADIWGGLANGEKLTAIQNE